MAKNVYFFGGGKADGKAGMKNLLGGKGANLAEMASLGIPVPAGFTITTEVCTEYYENKGKLPKSVEADVKKAMAKAEKVKAGVNNLSITGPKAGSGMGKSWDQILKAENASDVSDEDYFKAVAAS